MAFSATYSLQLTDNKKGISVRSSLAVHSTDLSFQLALELSCCILQHLRCKRVLNDDREELVLKPTRRSEGMEQESNAVCLGEAKGQVPDLVGSREERGDKKCPAS